MLIIFAVPYLIWRLGRTEYYAPLVIVQIIAGILLGPGIRCSNRSRRFSRTCNVAGSHPAVKWWARQDYSARPWAPPHWGHRANTIRSMFKSFLRFSRTCNVAGSHPANTTHHHDGKKWWARQDSNLQPRDSLVLIVSDESGLSLHPRHQSDVERVRDALACY
jgi:hypothetical protein